MPSLVQRRIFAYGKEMTCARHQCISWLCTFLVLATICRMMLVCVSYPIAAYANNYDFVRQSSCVGVWEDYPAQEKTLNHPEAPVNTLRYDRDIRPSVCLPSADNLFPWAVAHFAGPGGKIELREIGFLKATAATLFLLVLMSQLQLPALRLALAASAYCVIGDFALDLYFNTLYLESSVIIPMFMAIGLTIAAYCRRTEPRPVLTLSLLIALSWLGFARQQYSVFAAAIGLVAAAVMLLRWRSWRHATLLAVAAILIQFGCYKMLNPMNEHSRQADKANRADTFLGAVLPLAKDPQQALRVAGLPATCAASIGKTWYSAGFQANNPCPAVYGLSRTALIPLFLYDPRMIVSPLLGILHDSRPALLPYLGHFERPSDAGRLRYRMLSAMSLSTWLAALPPRAYHWLIGGVCLGGPVAFALALLRALRRPLARGDETDGALLMAGSGGVLVFYALASSVFGDGYNEAQRHAVGVIIGAGLAFPAIVSLAATRVASAWGQTQESECRRH